MIGWEPQSQGTITLNTDGLKKLESGMATANGITRDHRFNCIFGFAVNIEKTSNFIVKLWGLRKGLKIAKDRGLHNVEVEMDPKAFFNAIKNDNTYERSRRQYSYSRL